jgi:predicted metal-dependent phosphoesterase TrpH
LVVLQKSAENYVMYKVDLHTHSVADEQYRRSLTGGFLDVIAITDHNSIDFATRLNQELKDQIIVGEEIMTKDGEIIGLYLDRLVRPHQTLAQTIIDIKQQGGIVYVPHPFETVRKGIHPKALEEVMNDIDIIEVCNGRAFFQDRSQQAVVWARLNNVITAASSDAHGVKGLGKTYTIFSEQPTRDSLLKILSTATMQAEKPSVRALLYPKYHRLRKKLGGKGA